MPAASSDLPESRPGEPVALCLVLLRMGFTCAPPVARRAVVSYSAFPPLPGPKALSGNAPFSKHSGAVYFCCTGLGVASTGRYPASCPVKPGLSSPAALSLRDGQPRSLILLIFFLNNIPSRAVFGKPHLPLCHPVSYSSAFGRAVTASGHSKRFAPGRMLPAGLFSYGLRRECADLAE